MTDLSVRIVFSIHAMEPVVWDQLSKLQPFQSHRWYAFGEQVMTDCNQSICWFVAA